MNEEYDVLAFKISLSFLSRVVGLCLVNCKSNKRIHQHVLTEGGDHFNSWKSLEYENTILNPFWLNGTENRVN